MAKPGDVRKPTVGAPFISGAHGLSSETSLRDDAHAVVIGINTYLDTRIPNLHFARADAEAVYDVLTDPAVGHFRKENVALLVDGSATERGIKAAIGTQLPNRAEPGHIVCVFYAGHGAPLIDRRGRSSDGMEKYLVPHDADANDLRSTAISMDTIHDWFDWIHAKQVVFFIDTCYSGSAGGGVEGSGRRRTFDVLGPQTRAAVLTDDYLETLTSGEGRFVVTACRPNEVSIETPELGHGLFTHHLVAGLKGGADSEGTGLVTLDRLYAYVYNNVSRDARRLGGAMNPLSRGSMLGSIYLTQYETENQRRARVASSSAKAAFDVGALDEAEELWQEALVLEPENHNARSGLDDVRRRRAEATARLEREQQIAQATQDRRRRVLLKYLDAGQLTKNQFANVNDLLLADANELSVDDQHKQEFVLQLADEQISPKAYLRAIDTLSAALRSAVEPKVAKAIEEPAIRREPVKRRKEPSAGAGRAQPPEDKVRPVDALEKPRVASIASLAVAAIAATAVGLLIGSRMSLSSSGSILGGFLFDPVALSLAIVAGLVLADLFSKRRWIVRAIVATVVVAATAGMLAPRQDSSTELFVWTLTAALAIGLISPLVDRLDPSVPTKAFVGIGVGIVGSGAAVLLSQTFLSHETSFWFHVWTDGVAIGTLIGVVHDLLDVRLTKPASAFSPLVLVGAFLFWPETRQHVPEPTSPLVADTTPAQSRQPDSATQRDPSLVAPTTYFGFQVERPAAPSAGNPTPSYPEPLRSANLEGEVLAQFVVDTNGRADTSTFRILRQTNALFGTSVRAVLPRLRFTAAMISGRKVRQLVQQAFNFNITESGRITDSARVNAPGRRIVADPPRFLNSRLPLGPGDTVLFEDDFSTTRPELVHGPESLGCESRYLNGQIVLKNTKPGLSCHNAFNIPGRLGAPVRIEVSVQPLGGPRNRYFGFDFAVPGGEGVGAYRFVISDSGWAKLSMRGGMTSDDPMLVEQRSPVLRHGIGASNWLAVEIRGRTIRTFVNGRAALTPYESPVDLVGWLAFYLSSTDMEVAFDNVRITRLGRE